MDNKEGYQADGKDLSQDGLDYTDPEADGDSPGRPHSYALVWDHQWVPDRPQRVSTEPAHDILAAEAFAVPAADPRLRRDLVLPGDPAGIAEPHDVLAAEEFAMPAPEVGAQGSRRDSSGRRRLASRASVAGVFALWLWRRRRG